MSHLETNLDLLSRRQPELALDLLGRSMQNVEVFTSVSGIPSARCTKAGTTTLLHSSYDPLREAQHLIQKADICGADYFIILGFGLGYLLDALIESVADPACHYFVVEADPAILKAALASRDLSRILCLPNLHFAWPASGPELAGQWQTFLDPVRAQKSVFVRHPPSVALHPAYYASAAEVIQSQTFQTFTDINTLVARSQTFLDNFVQNLPRVIAAPGVSGYAGGFAGKPAVLVSAGPSLDKNIHALRSYTDRLLILSTDTALKPLLAAGIEPHFVLTGDPSYDNYLHLKGSRTTSAILVGEATCYPASLAELDPRIITCVFENSSLRSLSALLRSKGTLRAWGSVATMALDFALVLGCDPIIFIGQDLAHSDGRTYCSGLHFEKEWFDGVRDPKDWQLRWQRLADGKKTVVIRDIFGRPIETTDKLSAYWNWIVKEIRSHPEVKFVNATEGGILKEGVEIISLRDALHRYCSKDLHLRDLVSNTFCLAKKNVSGQPDIDLRVFERESAEISSVLQQGIRLCGDTSLSDESQLLQKLEAIKEGIYASRHVAPIVDSLNQMGNVAFLRRRAGLTKTAGVAPPASETRATYMEYFNTVGESLRKIVDALIRMSQALDPASGKEAGNCLG